MITEFKESAVVLVFNDQGQMILQKRAVHDSKYPSHWDFSAAGGIDPGENHLAAAIRETREEIGVVVDPEYIGEELYKDSKGQDRLFIYKARENGPFKPQPEEVDQIDAFSLNEIQSMLDSGVDFHPEFHLLWEKGLIKKAAETN
jgi:8-oxo-dGTP pyrophosphatase MutT (NUDIX family)